MTLLQTIIIALVEGVTEFLSVSSTGHMIIAQKLMGMPADSALIKVFTINIQFGAILSVVVLYWRRFFQRWGFYRTLLIAFLPAAVIGFAFNAAIDLLFAHVYVVAFMLLLGGAFMLVVDRYFNRTDDNQAVDWKRALRIGCFQCAAMIPGCFPLYGHDRGRDVGWAFEEERGGVLLFLGLADDGGGSRFLPAKGHD